MEVKTPLSVKQWNALKERLYDAKSTLKSLLGLRNTFGDRIIIEDEVLVYEGDKLLFKSRGHIVSQGLIGIVNSLGSGTAGAVHWSYTWGTKAGGNIHVGTGTGVTTAAMTSLVTDEGTDPDTQSGALASPAAGTYRVSWIGTWNAGVLAAIDVSELGLRLDFDASLNVFEASIVPIVKTFFSRLSDSDGDFTTFTVNTAVPLTIEWRLTFTFA